MTLPNNPERMEHKNPLTPVENFISLVDGLEDIQFWIKDRRGRFVAANRACLKAFELKTSDQLIGKTDLEVSPLYLAQSYVEDDKRVLANRTPIVNKMELVREKDGKLKWYSTSKTPLWNAAGEVWGTMGYTREFDTRQDTLPSKGMSAIGSFIHEHYEKHITVRQLAAIADLSIIQFERNFKKIFHTTPVKYLNQVRLEAACKLLLHSDLKISTIATQSGFINQSYFSRLFFNHYGALPRDYRRAAKKNRKMAKSNRTH